LRSTRPREGNSGGTGCKQRSVTRLAWLRRSAEGRTENQRREEGKVGYELSWLEQGWVLRAVWSREALGGVLGSGARGCPSKRQWPSICPRAEDALFAEEGRGDGPLGWPGLWVEGPGAPQSPRSLDTWKTGASSCSCLEMQFQHCSIF